MPEDEHSTTPSADCVQRAYLYLQRDASGGPPYSVDEQKLMAFDPDDVTRLVGLRPTETWRRGDLHRHAPAGRRRFSRWKYEVAKVRTYFTEEVVIQLLDAIEPHAAGITEACANLELQAGINVVIEMSGDRNTEDGGIHVSTAAITYTADTLKRLARLNLMVDHDQYVYLPD